MHLGQRVSLINFVDGPNSPPLVKGYIVGTATVVSDANHITNMFVVEVDMNHSGYMVSDDGVKRGYISRIVVHPDNIHAEED